MELKERKESARTGVSISSMLSVMELIIVIGIFAVISTFLLSFFTSANRLSEEAEALGKAVISAESVMELVKAEGFHTAVEKLDFSEQDGKGVLKYDRNFKTVKGEAAFLLILERTLEKEGAGKLYGYEIRVMRVKDGKSIFELSSKGYEKRGGV